MTSKLIQETPNLYHYYLELHKAITTHYLMTWALTVKNIEMLEV